MDRPVCLTPHHSLPLPKREAKDQLPCIIRLSSVFLIVEMIKQNYFVYPRTYQKWEKNRLRGG